MATIVIHKAFGDAGAEHTKRETLQLVKAACGRTIKWENTYADGVARSWNAVTCPDCLLTRLFGISTKITRFERKDPS